jgi:hypothetical protein
LSYIHEFLAQKIPNDTDPFIVTLAKPVAIKIGGTGMPLVASNVQYGGIGEGIEIKRPKGVSVIWNFLNR